MTNILFALLVVGGVGLVLAILLALISKFFGIPEDETKAKIRECLPGVNCGVCGYRGCDDYAEALAHGGVAPNLCIPGGTDCAAAVSKIIGKEAQEVEASAAFVGCNGNCSATGDKAVYDGIKSCRAAAAIYGGQRQCSYACLGYGDCAVVCPVDAIYLCDGIAHIDRDTCIGCGICARECPKSLISLIPARAVPSVMCHSHDKGAEAKKKCENACIACKKCEKSCEYGAITIIDNLAAIDYTKCTSCGACVSVCPTGCIKLLGAKCENE